MAHSTINVLKSLEIDKMFLILSYDDKILKHHYMSDDCSLSADRVVRNMTNCF